MVYLVAGFQLVFGEGSGITICAMASFVLSGCSVTLGALATDMMKKIMTVAIQSCQIRMLIPGSQSWFSYRLLLNEWVWLI